jgi:predicted GNAT family acetyltransferase
MSRPPGVRLVRDSADVEWDTLRAHLIEDDFDNGRTPEQLAASFAASAHVVFAVTDVGGVVIGTARMLSDGICNAYLVDVWTRVHWRRRGVATDMITDLLDRVPGQHVALFTDQAREFYGRLGFETEQWGMSRTVGRWLDQAPATRDRPLVLP